MSFYVAGSGELICKNESLALKVQDIVDKYGYNPEGDLPSGTTVWLLHEYDEYDEANIKDMLEAVRPFVNDESYFELNGGEESEEEDFRFILHNGRWVEQTKEYPTFNDKATQSLSARMTDLLIEFAKQLAKEDAIEGRMPCDKKEYVDELFQYYEDEIKESFNLYSDLTELVSEDEDNVGN